MADKEVKTEVVERDRYTEPREKNDPDHKDAGQVYVEEHGGTEQGEDAKG